MIQSVRRSRAALVVVALSIELVVAGWWCWPWTATPIQTPFDYGTGHVTVVSENWRRFGALRQHFLPVMSIDPELAEWPYRGEGAQVYTSVPPLAFILHYAATRALPRVEPVLLGKLLAQALIAASTIASAPFLVDAFGALAAAAGLSFAIWSVPYLLWFSNGYFAVNVGLAAQMVLTSWTAALAAETLRSQRTGGPDSPRPARQAALGFAVAFLGAFADYLPVFANALAAAGLLGVAWIAWRRRQVAAGAVAGACGVAAGTATAGLTTIVLYSRQLGFAMYRQMITLRVAQRSGEATLGRHFDVIRTQMLTAWPAPVAATLFAAAAIVVAWSAASIVRRRRSESDQGTVALLALAVASVPSFLFHFRAVNYVSLHWWFAGTWIVAWTVVVCAVIRVARAFAARNAGAAPLRRFGPVAAAAFAVIALIATDARFAAAHSVFDAARSQAVVWYRALGRDLPRYDRPLVVTDVQAESPALFEEFPYVTAYMRRPVLLREPDGRIRLPQGDAPYADRFIHFGGEDVRGILRRRGDDVYIAYDPDAHQCYGAPVALSPWHRSVPLAVCRVSAEALTAQPSTALSPLRTGYPCTAAPEPPPDVHVASNAGGTVKVSWSASATHRTSYILEAGRSHGQADALTESLGRSTTFTATNVLPGTYYVRVRGRNACGIGRASNELTIVVDAH